MKPTAYTKKQNNCFIQSRSLSLSSTRMNFCWCAIFVTLITGLNASCCPAYWINGGEECFRVEKNMRKTWVQANEYCKSLHPDSTLLRTKHISLVNNALKIMGNLSFWVDITDQENEGVYKYSNGEKVKVLVWDLYHPCDQAHTKNCLEFHTWGLKDNYCNDNSHKRPFICSLKKHLPASGHSKRCSAGGTYHSNGRCMKLLTPKTHDEAKRVCEDQGGHLATMITPNDLNSITAIAYPDGMTNGMTVQDSRLWIGLSWNCSSDQWKWDDQSPFHNENLKWRSKGSNEGSYVSVDLKDGLMDCYTRNSDQELRAVCSSPPL